jgi:intracellular sulfur oxidation DsrE/DsrF family protein
MKVPSRDVLAQPRADTAKQTVDAMGKDPHAICSRTLTKLIRAAVLSLGLFAAGAAPVHGGAGTPTDFWQMPTVPGFGKMHPLPEAAYQPQKAAIYKIVFDVIKAGDKPDEVSPSLGQVARAVNLYASAGVPLDHLKFVAVLHGNATAAALDDAHYKQQFGVDNPNLEVIRKLRAAGTDVAVCGQAMAEHRFQYEWKAPSVTLALSALTTITVLEHEGYALMPL